MVRILLQKHVVLQYSAKQPNKNKTKRTERRIISEREWARTEHAGSEMAAISPFPTLLQRMMDFPVCVYINVSFFDMSSYYFLHV